ncbi:MAG: PRC-barrel domain protein [Firmicutes bacterium ADurb.Bin262]|nr:MAG: PRC-barrel domain protein [Firmicutes bacterium ADurb.Bin262]
MLVNTKLLKGFRLHCTDGEIGTVKDFIFCENDWAVRYLAIETGSWLMDRQVLIPIRSLTEFDGKAGVFSVNLTRQQVESSPPLYLNEPITTPFEEQYHQYYGLPSYNIPVNTWLPIPAIMSDSAVMKEAVQGDKNLQPGLHSTESVRDRRLQATDGEIGYISDLILDDESWAVRYFVVNTHSWLPGRKVLIAPDWIDFIGPEATPVSVKVLREQVRKSPEYTDACELNRDYEEALHEHYKCKGYWDVAQAAGKDDDAEK